MTSDRNIILHMTLGWGLLFALAGCQSGPKAQITSNTPDGAILEVTNLKERALSDQADLLAYKDYRKGAERLEKARVARNNNDSAEVVFEEASTAKAYFQKSRESASARKTFSAPILEARRAATAAGARESRPLLRELKDIDESVRSETDNFSKELPLKEFSKIQNAYLKLEVSSVEYTQLNRVRSIIQMAKSEDADERAPKTFAQAKLDEAAAKNLIVQNTHSPKLYEPSVKKANDSATLLNDVMAKIKEMGPNTSEKVALNLVQQDRKIGALNNNLEDMETNLDTSKADAKALMGTIDNQNTKLKNQNSELENVSGKVSVQRAIESARARFSADEADAYQQGDRLVIRLKKMNFRTGSEAIPTNSLKVLAEVREVIDSLDAEQVTVEGHTDSTGKAAYNQKLSKNRAESVAGYFQSLEKDLNVKSVGRGETKPIASNSTKEGRASNRRVDIVISVKK